MYRLNAVFKRIFIHPLNSLGEFWEKYNQFAITQRLSVLATNKELDALAGGQEVDESVLRVKLLESVEQYKKRTEATMAERQQYEVKIDRDYYHVTPMAEAAQENWRAYLMFEEKSGSKDIIERLYERCLVACADYPEFWMRFAAWKESTVDVDAACAIYDRATKVHLRHSGEIHLQYALLLEGHERLDQARAMYMKTIDQVDPKYAPGFVQYANFERRQGNVNAAEILYQSALEKVLEKDYDEIAMQYAMFQFRVC